MGLFSIQSNNKPVKVNQGTYAGNGLKAMGDFANNHSTLTRVLECSTFGIATLAAIHSTLKRYAPEQHEKYIASPVNKHITLPLQNKGWIAKPAESEQLYKVSKGYLYNSYVPVEKSDTKK